MHTILRKLFLFLAAGVLIANLTGCGGGGGGTTNLEQTGVRVTASVAGLASPTTRSTNITPSAYKLALVNFWLIREDGSEINIINPDEQNPTYTEDNPLIVSFTSNNQANELLSTVPPGTYTGYKMQFLYMEMRYPAVFHIPNLENETEYANASSVVDTIQDRNFRLYFNAIGKYWKRDFVVELDDNSDEWYWMRSNIEDNSEDKNFFISVANNDHPGGNGFYCTIDLFHNPEFWGERADESSNANPIIISTESTVGGVDARLDHPFTIPEVLDDLYTINVEVNVADTLNFWEDVVPAEGVTFMDGVLDLGPIQNTDHYGDQGLHPFVPRFNVTVTAEDEGPSDGDNGIPDGGDNEPPSGGGK